MEGRFQLRKATVDEPKIEVNAVNFGAIATAFCWAIVVMFPLLITQSTMIDNNNIYYGDYG